MAYATPALTLIGRASGLVLGSVAKETRQLILDRPPLADEVCNIPIFYSFVCHGLSEW